MKRGIILLGAVLSLSFSALACTAGQSAEHSAQTSTEQSASLIKHINAKYMREHIFDYKANPNRFVFKGDKPAILDFYADWCGPCRQLSPRLEALAKKYEGKIDIYKINVDNEEELAKVFGVRSIPMLLFIGTDGETPSVSQGALSAEELESEVQRLFKVIKK